MKTRYFINENLFKLLFSNFPWMDCRLVLISKSDLKCRMER